MRWQFWIDRGGTFTDLFGISPDGEHIVRKVLSEQPGHLIDPAIKAIREVLNLQKEEPIPNALIQEVRLGTTVATNSLLEGTGSPVILFCNRGFKDLLRIGDQHRSDLFSLKIERPKFIANAVIEVSGRIDAKGVETEPFVIDKELEKIASNYCLNQNTSCAIALLNSYSNPKHELHLKDWLKQVGFNTVICSHNVSLLPRLVPRGQTTLIEANVSPVLFSYLKEVNNALGTSTRLRIMGSSGALLIPNRLLAKDTILSGPAGGMVGAVAAARDSGKNQQPLIGFDMGGTSTDVFYVPKGQENDWERYPETEIAGQKLLAQRLPIHTVAAGGGSIISTDGERIQVGPRSAGANPGPACYRRGGPLTITDANLYLGRLHASTFPALFGPKSNQIIDVEIVKKGFTKLAQSLFSTPEKIAEGALAIAIERMADAIKRVSIFCGHDIRDGLLVAFGGAGGQHACRLAEHLGLKEVLIHPFAGVLSAYGLGVARQNQFRTLNISKPLSEELIKDLWTICEKEQILAEELLRANGDLQNSNDSSKPDRLAKVEIRYQSREQGIMVKLNRGTNTKELIKKFKSAHLTRFGYIPTQTEQLIVDRLEIEVIAPHAAKISPKPNKNSLKPIPPKLVLVHWPDSGWRKVPCYKREYLSPKCSLKGPALIVESTSSIVLEVGWTATIDLKGNLLMRTLNSKTSTNDRLLTKNKDQADPILLELFHHRFSGIAEKMGERLRQTSRSINIHERLDFSCAIFDIQGELVANAPHIPVHLGAMGESIVDLLAQISSGKKNPLRPSETVLSNDPFHGGTHLPDITAITPVFAGSRTPQYFVACRGHHADVGGLTPGSMPSFSKTIDDEGLLIRNETFVVNGHHNQALWNERLQQGRMPPRNPKELIADLHAQVAANQLGVNELEKLIAHAGQEEVSMYMTYLQMNAALAVQKLIRTLNDGAFSVELDNGATLSVEISIDKMHSRAKLDFSKTSPQGEGNFQAPLAVTKAAVLYVFRCLIEEDIPLNSGCFKPLELIVPKGCLLNPISPAAVVAGNVETSQALCNLLFGAFGVLSASQGTMNNLTFGDDNNQYYETVAGGSGAGNGFNGTDGIQTHMTNSRLTDPEIIEQRYPVQIEHFSIRQGSGGQGQWTGGNGLIRKFRFLAPMTVSILSGSRRIAPFGLAGGKPGAIGLNQHELIDGQVNNLKGCSRINIVAGEAIQIITPGGGGYGKPTKKLLTKMEESKE